VLAGVVQPGAGRTLYARFGDAFAVGCALAVALALLARMRRAQA
jgi:apolipoprotein N-acyltransferase